MKLKSILLTSILVAFALNHASADFLVCDPYAAGEVDHFEANVVGQTGGNQDEI